MNPLQSLRPHEPKETPHTISVSNPNMVDGSYTLLMVIESLRMSTARGRSASVSSALRVPAGAPAADGWLSDRGSSFFESYKPLEPREGEPRQPKTKATQDGLLGGLLGPEAQMA